MLRHTTAQHVRATIAQYVLGSEAQELSVGNVRLYPHQTAAVHRLQAAIAEFGGALLADEVGLGKTYVALAVAAAASEHATRILIVAPATLGPMWHSACAQAQIDANITSMEALSYRIEPLAQSYNFIIVDEAHQARTPSTKRYTALAQLCAQSRVLLLSATPIHNTRGDLTSLLALFLGTRADTLSESELGRLIVRRTQSRVQAPSRLPRIRRTHWLRPTTDERLLNAILKLPPAVPPRHAGEANTLVRHALLRQWTSSDGALRNALRRRRGQALALLSALEAGHYPTKQELQSWICTDDTIQLAFPELLSSYTLHTKQLAETVRTHADALHTLLQAVIPSSINDQRRAATILHLRHKHSGEKIVAFSQYADTIETLFRLLRPTGRVAALTSRGGLVAGGRISRQETITRFAPAANGATPPAACNEITLLLTTDILSEGVNLQDASVILHLDLPWTAAKFEQRIGRIARLGSLHHQISVYGFRPPRKLDRILRMTEIIDAKSHVAQRTIGGQPLHIRRDAPRYAHSVPEDTEVIHQHLSYWMPSIPPENSARKPTSQHHALPCIAAVRHATSGFLALCLVDGIPTLITTDAHTEPTTALPAIQTSLHIAQHPDAPIDQQSTVAALRAIQQWYDTAHAACDAGISALAPRQTRTTRTQRALLRRIAALNASTPLARRGQIAAVTQAARNTIAVGHPSIFTQKSSPTTFTHNRDDDSWLHHFAKPSVTSSTSPPPPRTLHVVALLLFY